MKTKTLILVIVVIASVYFGYRYFVNKDKKLTDEKKYIQEQEGTRKWLLGQYKQLFKDQDFYRAPELTTGKVDLAEGGTLAPLKVDAIISQSRADQKGVDWARNIMIGAIQKKISYKQAVDNNLKYLMIEKWGYNLNEDF